MKNIKKFIFAVICVLAMSFGISGYGIASVKPDQKFADWTVVCNGTDKEKICFLTQQVNNTTEDKKTEAIAVYQVGYFKKDKTLFINQIVPLGVAIQPGTSIISDKKLIIAGKFTICTNGGCNSLAEISNSDLNQLLSNEKAEVAIMFQDGKQVNLPLTTKGLKEGIKALK